MSDYFKSLEGKHGLPAGLLDAVWEKESARGKHMRSPVGAMGHFQFMPATAKQYGLTNPDDLNESAGAAARMYGDLLKKYGGDLPKALAAYNWGSGNVDRKGLDRAPAETRDYITKISGKVQPKAQTMDFTQQIKQAKDAGYSDAEILGHLSQSPKHSDKFKKARDAGYSDAEIAQHFGLTVAAQPAKQAAAPEPSIMDSVKQGAGNVLAGAVRGAGSIGATVMRALPNALGGDTAEENAQRRTDMDAALQTMGAEPDSLLFKGGKLGAEIAGTAGAGGIVGRGVGAVANIAGRGAQAAPLVQALATSGFRAGGATGLPGVLTRAAGGAVTGGVSAGAVNPDDAGTGAAIGAALPGVLQLAGKAGGAAGRVVRDARTPAIEKAANKLAAALDMTPEQLKQAISQQGPNMLPGYQATVPQILQNPVTSQLQRTLKTAGSNTIGDAERAQQVALRNALERVAPLGNTVQDAAERAGGAIQTFGKAERAAVSKQVSTAFDGVDPFGESAVYLPIDEMQGAASKYLGAGTFGTGGKAEQALQKAREVGTTELPAVALTTKSAIGKTQAVRAAGGIKPGAGGMGGEIGDLMNRQSGTSGLVNAKSGQPVDLLASDMYRRGFLPDDDPATLLEMLRGGGGRKVYLADVTDDAFRGRMESAMGDAPEAATMAKSVNFETMQNLRSSMGEAAEQASLAGNKKEAAALRQMVSEIDGKLKTVADGGVSTGEYFAPDMVKQYRTALEMHADKMQRFETGPQAGMFRKAGDGQMQVQGAEIPGKFFNGKRSQVEDMQAFKRLIGDRADLADELKRFAVTEGASTSNVAGDLTSKYIKWMDSRSGGLRELLTPQELATMREVGKAVQKQIDAENLGRVSGSDTAQKLASLNSLGALDSRVVDVLANRIPLVGQFTGPMLTGLRNTAAQSQNNYLSKLLADPAALSEALKKGSPHRNELMRLVEAAAAGSLKAAPLIPTQ